MASTGVDMESNDGGEEYDAVIVGAGFAGLYMLHRLRNIPGFSARVYEAGDGVGGTWYWNRYPGGRVDTESYLYCYSFSKELYQSWEWSGKYPQQPEVLAYLNHVADRFDLRTDIELGTQVTSVTYLEGRNRWEVELDGTRYVQAKFLITGIGLLASTPNVPDFPGLDSFQGDWYHTGRWPHDPVDFRSKRVGVIGTGSTGIQTIPVIAEDASHLYVFQRTPQFAIPARHESITREDLREIKQNYDEIWRVAKWSMNGFDWGHNGISALAVSASERRETFESMWQEGGFEFLAGSYRDILTDRRANEFVAEFVRSKIREIVDDPALAEAVLPVDYPIGARRPILDTNYYETYNRDNVTLVDVRQYPITAVTKQGIRTADGDYDLDVIVFATGFDAVSGPFLRLNINGKRGLSLSDEWGHHGPRSYLGLTVSGFPNFFTITGPGSLFGNLPVSIEHHVEWIADCIEYMRARGYDVADVEPTAQEEWMDHVNEQSLKTLIPLSDSSWFTGGNIPGKPRSALLYFGDFGEYRRHVDSIAKDGYPGIRLSSFAVERTDGVPQSGVPYGA